MCGFTGYWSPKMGADEGLGLRMADRIAHRGPDDHGAWADPDCGLVLAHRRLAIIDLSAAGHQPMVSESGQLVIAYNGEIYNHLELRQLLTEQGAAPEWRGHSDTETLLAALSHWGLEETLGKLNGMFAFALWDRKSRILSLARDRMGEKPLYYGRVGNSLLFGSELKSFDPHPDWHPELDRGALSSFLRHNYIPGPKSIYHGIFKLPPANFIQISDPVQDLPAPTAYWDIDEVARKGVNMPRKSEGELLEELEALLLDSVKLRMASDVPLGAFLSGGYDSSIVTAMMQAQSDRPVKTFTIGFEEAGFNEAEHAKKVADHLQTNHTELYLTSQDSLDLVPQLPKIWDEPFSDSSQMPTLLLSQLTRKHVTVSLSGDGGDELFCGYSRYEKADSIHSKLRLVPGPLRGALGAAMLATPKLIANGMEAVLPSRLGARNLADRLPKLGEVLSDRCDASFYRSFVSHWREPNSVVIGGAEESVADFAGDAWGYLSDFKDRMMLADMKTYLPDDILVKVDRASMAVSLEGRIPLLDHRLVELAWQVPASLKMRDGKGKFLLRETLYKYVPREIMDRPKMGFGVPIESWLTGSLREWAEDLLSEERLKADGIFEPAIIRKYWEEHTSGTRRWHNLIWDILMFQSWYEEHGKR